MGAVPDIIDNEVNGFIVPIGDYELLAEKILYLRQHPEKRMKMGRNNLRKFRREYCIEINVERIDKIYHSLLK